MQIKGPTNLLTCTIESSFKPIKDIISYSQALRINAICSTTSNTKGFKERGYLENLINEQVDKVKNMKRKQLFSSNKRTIQNRIPVLITYNKHLPNISNVITKNWRILQISPTFQKVFDNKPMIT